MIEVPIYLLDPVADTYNPDVVKTGVCKLLSGGEEIDSPVEFDRRFGTAKGSFMVFFHHPSSLHDLAVTIDLTVINGTVEDPYHFETQVTHVEAEDSGLEAQPLENEAF
jgi:hypothetical protein